MSFTRKNKVQIGRAAVSGKAATKIRARALRDSSSLSRIVVTFSIMAGAAMWVYAMLILAGIGGGR
jgi:hypothetical protein